MPNPLDEIALEMALRLRDEIPSSVSIRACSVGGEPSRHVLQDLLACGTDQAVWLLEDLWEPDGTRVAGRLCEYYRSEPFDLGLFGMQDVDTGAGQVGPMFSVLAGLAFVDSVVDMKWDRGNQIEVTCVRQRVRERIRMTLPACVGILRGKPIRYPSFWGKRKAQKIRIHPIPASRPSDPPCLERKRFASSKPRKGSTMSAYAEASGADKIRQALGFKDKDTDTNRSVLIQGDPEKTARKILDIWSQEKVVELD